MKYFSMFTGVGGAEIGIQQAHNDTYGDERNTKNLQNIQSCNNNAERWRTPPLCVGMCEWDKYASEVLAKRFPGVKNYKDATKINTKELPRFDLLVAGFPCQAFSIAGQRRGFEDTRGTLFFEVARVLKAKRPRYCVLENVKGLLSHDQGKTYATILSTLQELGYDVEWGVLNTRYFGIPQNRERVYIVGVLRGECGRKVFPIRRTDQEVNGTARHQISNVSKREAGFKDFCPAILSRDYKDPKVVKAVDVYNKNSRDEVPSLTEPHHNSIRVQEPNRIRKLTPTECESLQGFPKGWTDITMSNGKRMSDTQRYKQMGNAMSVPVVAAVIKELLLKLKTFK